MSDNTDERMDRARRIRELREGDRTEQDPESGAEAAEQPESEAAEQPESEAAEQPESEAAEQPDPENGAGTAADSAGEPVPDDGAVGTEPDDAAAVAGRAAADEGTPSSSDVGGTVAAPDADSADDPAVGGSATGLEMPDQETLAAAVEGADGAVDGAPGQRAGAVETTTDEETVRVLEFTLGPERYCLDIDLVEEIVERETVTRVPNTSDAVEGVVDLRGQITTVLDPRRLLEVDADAAVGDDATGNRLVVFDPDAFEDQGALGWLVDEVRQVAAVAESTVTDPPVEDEYVEGVVERDGDFVVWVDPGVAIRAATTADEA